MHGVLPRWAGNSPAANIFSGSDFIGIEIIMSLFFQSRFVVIDRRTGENLKTVYEAPPFMTFHHSNAYEKDGHLIVDLCHYKDASVIQFACLITNC